MQNFLHIWNGMVKGFPDMYILSLFGQFIFCKHFYFITGFCKKNSIFANLQFFADSKSRVQELSNDVSFVIFGHQTWDLEGGGVKLTPPPRILVFKYPSRDRVKLTHCTTHWVFSTNSDLLISISWLPNIIDLRHF